MKEYKQPTIEITAVRVDDVIALSSFAVRDTGVDTPLISATPGIPSIGTPGSK